MKEQLFKQHAFSLRSVTIWYRAQAAKKKKNVLFFVCANGLTTITKKKKKKAERELRDEHSDTLPRR